MTKTMWAVGPDGGEGWIAIDATSEDAARAAWARGYGHPLDDYIDIVAMRIAAWDNLPGAPAGTDWLRVGLGYSCSRCGEMAFADSGGRVIDSLPVCESCSAEHEEPAP